MTVARSLRELGRGVGRAHQVVARWVARPDWDQASRPPWDIEQAKAWAARTLGPNPADGGAGDAERDAGASDGGAEPDASDGLEALRRHPLQAARLRLTLIRAEKMAIEKAILAGEFVPRVAVEAALIRRAHAAKAALEALPRQLSERLAGLEPREIEGVLSECIAGVLDDLSRRPLLPASSNEVEAAVPQFVNGD